RRGLAPRPPAAQVLAAPRLGRRDGALSGLRRLGNARRPRADARGDGSAPVLLLPHGHGQGRVRVPDPHRLPRRADGRPSGRHASAVHAAPPRMPYVPRARADVPDVIEVQLGDYRRVALRGGIYSNRLARREALRLARARGAEAVVAMGDFGAFGPHPDRTVEILRAEGLPAIQGNYEESLASAADDCHCGYTDPRDNHYAKISYDYTRDRTSGEHEAWMGTLPGHARLTVGGRRVLLCHGSPRRINEFLWASTTPEPFIRKLLRDFDTDVVACTHTGIPWQRFVGSGRGVVN